MSGSVKRALIIYGAAVLVAVAALHQQATPVRADDCQAVNEYDLPRDCTFMESYGACLVGAMDSLDTCLSAAGNVFSQAGCWIGYEVDFYACLPAELLGAFIP